MGTLLRNSQEPFSSTRSQFSKNPVRRASPGVNISRGRRRAAASGLRGSGRARHGVGFVFPPPGWNPSSRVLDPGRSFRADPRRVGFVSRRGPTPGLGSFRAAPPLPDCVRFASYGPRSTWASTGLGREPGFGFVSRWEKLGTTGAAMARSEVTAPRGLGKLGQDLGRPNRLDHSSNRESRQST